VALAAEVSLASEAQAVLQQSPRAALQPAWFQPESDGEQAHAEVPPV
jgi:hypothetical protein